MKKRLHDKKAGIAILISLIIISLAEVIFRAVAMGEAVLTTANLGEQIVVIALAVTILILTAKGKDRACYICYGAWIGYFVLDQLFELPGIVVNCIALLGHSNWEIAIGDIALLFRILSMGCIVAIGVLVVEYMIDGTIYNRAFNKLCIATVLMILVNIGISLYDVLTIGDAVVWLEIFNNLYRFTMIFMFTFFAYDSAKAQLKKTDLTK